ncbi:MAG: TPM domain-containing protein [Rhodospirillales bacterium]|nr:TPM domain-containing protein [Rhodospirillales bacterium]
MTFKKIFFTLLVLAIPVTFFLYKNGFGTGNAPQVTAHSSYEENTNEQFSTSYIEDSAGILGAFTHHLDRMAEDWRDDLGVEIKIVTLNGGSQDINVLANRLFKEKEIGKTAKNGGVLILIDSGRRDARIEVSYSLEGLFTDAQTGLLARNQLAPYASYRVAGMAVMDVMRFLNDSALEQAVYGNFNLPEQFENSEEFQTRKLLYSGGGGAKTDIPDVPTDTDFKKPVPANKQALYAPGSTPEKTIEAYKRSLKDYIGTPELPLFTEGSQEMRRRYPFAPYEAKVDLRGILAAEPLTIYTEGDYAAALPPTPVSGYRPVLMKKTGGVWQIDMVETIKNLFFISGGKYVLQNKNTPYYFALNRLNGEKNKEDIAAFAIPEGDLKKLISALEKQNDPLSRFMLAELLFRNAFAAVDALRYYEEAARTAPADPLFVTTFAKRALYLHFPELALPYIERLGGDNDFLLARAYAQMERYGEIERLMRARLKRNAWDRQALVRLGWALEQQGKTGEAEKTDRIIEKLDVDPKKPGNPVALDFAPAMPVYHAKNTTMVGSTKVYGFSAFTTGMTNTSARPVQIDSIVLTSVGTGRTSGLGDIKDYWHYGNQNRILQPGERISFNKTWGFTVDPGHQRLSYLFDVCWHAVGSPKKQCDVKRLDLVSDLNVLKVGWQ